LVIGGAWPFLVRGVICQVYSDNERDLNLLIRLLVNELNHLLVSTETNININNIDLLLRETIQRFYIISVGRLEAITGL